MNAPFHNIIHNSNMHQPSPDPAWALGLSARGGLNGLRDHLRDMALHECVLTRDQQKQRLEEFMRRSLALLALSFDDDKAVLDSEMGVGEDTIGLSIAHQLTQIFLRADDTITCLSMLDAQDIGDFAERAELQIAALIHGHFTALEMTDV